MCITREKNHTRPPLALLMIAVLVVVGHTVQAFSHTVLVRHTKGSFATVPDLGKSLEWTSTLQYKSRARTRITLAAEDNDDGEDVKLGSKEYYEGFVSRGLTEDKAERVTGDAVLGPTLKFVGGFAAVIGTFLLVFLASNGLI